MLTTNDDGKVLGACDVLHLCNDDPAGFLE